MESTEKSKYEQMLSQYDIALKDSEVAAKVAAIVEKCLPENDTLAVKKFLMGSIELTTLKKIQLIRLQILLMMILGLFSL